MQYRVEFKESELGAAKFIEQGYNTGGKMKCNIASNVNITIVRLTVSFETVRRSFMINVSETSISTAGRSTGEPFFFTLTLPSFKVFDYYLLKLCQTKDMSWFCFSSN